MKCPFCLYGETKVTDKRETGDEDVTRRRRQCLKCHKRFTTYERIEAANLIVVKKDGRREAFDRNKLRTGLMKACEKRPISQEQIEQVVSTIEDELRKTEAAEIKSVAIGTLVMKRLKKMDKVAYIRYASVYHEFADVTSFEKELRKLVGK